MKVTNLEQRYIELSNEIVSLLCTGKGECYVNQDRIVFPPKTVEKFNNLLSRRAEVYDLIEKEDNARN